MAEILGAMTILDRAFPTGLDGTRIGQWRMRRASMDFGRLAQMLAVNLETFNSRMLEKWGWLFFIREDDYLEYENGGTVTRSRKMTDVDDIDMTSGTTIGHMLPLNVYGEAVGGSKRAMRDITEQRFLSSVRTNIRKLEWAFEYEVLSRVFTDTENQLGSNGYDVGWVTSTGNVVFTPPAYDGNTFASHSHYIGVDSGSNDLEDLLESLVATVQEHGHDAPFSAIVSRADALTYRGLTRFVETVDTNVAFIDRGGETSGNRYFVRGVNQPMQIGRYQSAYGDIDLYATARITTGYAAVVKSAGQNNPRNPLAIRVHPDVGFGAYIEPETLDDNRYPIKKLVIPMEFGVSVNEDRTAGAAGRLVAGGAWTNATIS